MFSFCPFSLIFACVSIFSIWPKAYRPHRNENSARARGDSNVNACGRGHSAVHSVATSGHSSRILLKHTCARTYTSSAQMVRMLVSIAGMECNQRQLELAETNFRGFRDVVKSSSSKLLVQRRFLRYSERRALVRQSNRHRPLKARISRFQIGAHFISGSRLIPRSGY